MRFPSGPPRDPEWCAEQIRAMWQAHSRKEISAYTHLSVWFVKELGREMGLPKVKRGNRTAPSFEEWRSIAIEEAERAGLDRMAVISGAMSRKACEARWLAWNRLMGAGKGYTLAGIGRTTGFDHASIRSAIRAIESGWEPRPSRPKPIPLITMPEFATEARG